MASLFPEPQTGASLLLAFRLQECTTLIVGSNSVAASRAFASLEAGATVLILAAGRIEAACPELQHRINAGQVSFIDLDVLLEVKSGVGGVVDELMADYPSISLVCITDTVNVEQTKSSRRSLESAQEFCAAFRRHRIPINVSDLPALCTFTFPTSHRFTNPQNGLRTPLQISITTNGQGCRLGSRLKREIVASLPPDVGVAVEKVGQLREVAKMTQVNVSHHEVSEAFQAMARSSTPNTPVSQTNDTESPWELTQRRMRWVAQLSEYWPLQRLAQIVKDEMHSLLQAETPDKKEDGDHIPGIPMDLPASRHGLEVVRCDSGKGQIYLIGSGLGHPSLLTVASRDVLTQRATFVLSDKLVPSAVLDIIPKGVKVVIAKKFPGNADGAQKELMEQAVEAAQRGEIVVRLKQGDPMVYGRAGEEILFLRSKGFEAVVIPGISSAIAGPLFAGIPVTQRGAAESFIVCTGVGRQGKEVQVPGYKRERTTVILMGVARLSELLCCLLELDSSRRDGDPYPAHLPIAIVERASLPDQRVVFSTLASVQESFESIGEQRPPGLMVIGWGVLALAGHGDMRVLDSGAEEHDAERSSNWLGSSSLRVVEGLDAAWKML